MSSSEFKKGEILSANYTAAVTPADATSSIDFSAVSAANKLGGQIFVRFERKDGKGINDSETFSGETVAQVVAAFVARKGNRTTEFDNLTLSDAGSNILNIVVDARDALDKWSEDLRHGPISGSKVGDTPQTRGSRDGARQRFPGAAW